MRGLNRFVETIQVALAKTDAPRKHESIEPGRLLQDTKTDMTPMVDVTFLLLIFFMVTAAFALQKSIAIPPHKAGQHFETVLREDENCVTVQVDEFNSFHVITTDWEEEAPSIQDLHRFLRQARDSNSSGRIPKRFLVEANGAALYENVVAALDLGSLYGFQEILLASVDDE